MHADSLCLDLSVPGVEFGVGLEYTYGSGVGVHTGSSMIEWNGIFAMVRLHYPASPTISRVPLGMRRNDVVQKHGVTRCTKGGVNTLMVRCSLQETVNKDLVHAGWRG